MSRVLFSIALTLFVVLQFPAVAQTAEKTAGSGLPVVFIPDANGERFETRLPGLRVGLDENGMGFVLRSGTDEAHVVRVDFTGDAVTPSGIDRHRARLHRLVGERSAWRRDVPTWTRVRYSGLADGVDLEIYERDGHVEYDVFLAPGSVNGVVFECKGAAPTVVEGGALVLQSEAGPLRFARPKAWQIDKSGREVPLPARYRLLANGHFEVRVDGRDPGLFAVIDPVVVYTTYLGGSNADEASAVALESDGTAYITGWTSSGNFPVTAGSLAMTRANEEGFVARLAPGGELVWATFFGGTSNDRGLGIGVEEDGGVMVVGRTSSNDFPVTAGAFQTTRSGGNDAFCLRLTREGDQLQYSTYLGGSSDDQATAVAVDRNGVPYIAGWTHSANFPINVTSIQAGNNGGRDGFVVKLVPDGTGLAFSTLLGGSDHDEPRAIAVDRNGYVYVGGRTASSDFPLRTGAVDITRQGYEGFVSKLNPRGTALSFSTFLGGSGDDEVNGLVVDANRDVYVIGATRSNDFAVAGSGAATIMAGSVDGFVTKLNSLGSGLDYSRYLGGTGRDECLGIALDAYNSVWVVGVTASSDFPVSPDAEQSARAGADDAFMASFDALGTPIYGTYLGGSGDDQANAVAIEPFQGLSIVVGSARAGLPTTPMAFGASSGGGRDAFVTRIGHGFCGSPARVHTLSRGCGATLFSTPPRLGRTAILTVSNAEPLSRGFLMFSGPGASPITLAPGCQVYLDLPSAQLLASFLTDAGGQWNLPIPVQKEPSMCGLSMVVQGAVVGPTGPLPFGALTDALLVFLGD